MVTGCTTRNQLFARSKSHLRLFLVLGAIGYVYLLMFSYKVFVAPAWGYMGLRYVTPPTWAVFVYTVLAVAPALWMPLSLKRPSQVAYSLMYLMAYVPSLVMPWFLQESPTDFIMLANTVLFTCFLLLTVSYYVPLARVPRVRVAPARFWRAVFAASMVLTFVLIGRFGLRIDVPRLSDVYSIRAQYKESLIGASSLMDYLVTWEAYVIAPLLICSGLVYRRANLVAAGIAGELVVFSITGLKSSLLAPLGLVFMTIVLKRVKFPLITLLTLGTCGLIVASSVLAALGKDVLMDYIFRRLFLVPGQLTTYYFEFFRSNPKALLGHSIFRLIARQYSESPPVIIGHRYISNVTHANANVWADAFANFGFGGMIFFTAMLSVVFWAFDSVSKRNMFLSSLMMVIPGITLSNSALLTSLLAHGIGLSLLLIYLAPAKCAERDNISSAP